MNLNTVTRKILKVSYNGNYINGWTGDVKGKGIFVSTLLKTALYKLTQQHIKLVCAGRTDSGVHAMGQICHFDINTTLNNNQIYLGVNTYLPHFISVESVNDISSKFSARFSAKSRTYTYYIYDAHHIPAILFNRVYWCRFNINWHHIKVAMEQILLFPSMKCFALKSFIGKKKRGIHNITLVKDHIFTYPVYKFTITSKSFMHHQIRIMIHTLLEVGRGKLSMKQFILNGMTELDGDYSVGKSCGLYLTSIKY